MTGNPTTTFNQQQRICNLQGRSNSKTSWNIDWRKVT